MAKSKVNGSRRRWCIVIAVAALVVLWIGIQVIKVMFGIVSPNVDYGAKITEAVAARQSPDGENGWPTFARALELFSEVSRESVNVVRESGVEGEEADALYRDYQRVLHGPADRGRWTVELEELAALKERGVFDLMSEAATSDRAIAPVLVPDADFGNTLAFGLFEYEPGSARQLAAALTCQMRIATLDGRWDEHQRLLDEALACSAMVGQQGMAVGFRVGLRSNVFALDELIYELNEGLVPAVAIEGLDGAVARRMVWVDDADLIVEVERLAMRDAVQQWYTDSVIGVGFVVPSRVPGISGSGGGFAEFSALDKPTILDRFSNLRGLVMARSRSTKREIEQWTADWLAVYRAVPADWQVKSALLDAEYSQRWSNHEVLGVIAIGGHGKVLTELLDVHRKVRLVRLMLAFESFHADNRAYPSSLDALEDLIESEVLIDPLSDKPFGYRQIDETGDGREYLIFAGGASADAPNEQALNATRPEQ